MQAKYACLQVFRLVLLFFVATALLSASGWAQSTNASVSGTVRDPAGAVVPAAELTLTNIATQTQAKFVSDDDGNFAFRNLVPGSYELRVAKVGFREYAQRGIELALNATARLDVVLTVGGQDERVEVVADASPLNFENATREEGISPKTLQDLPIIVGGGPRSAASVAVLMPGVSTGGQGNAFDARINGGLQSGDEATLDGVSMQEGFMSQSGMVAIQGDFALSPDMISEVKVMTSNYEPQYGSTTSGQITATTRSGTNDWHFNLFEYHRNTVLNARQFGADKRPKNLQHNFGGNVGGPIYLPRFGEGGPPLYSGKDRTHFFVNYEAFRIVGGVSRPTISIPSLRQRQGDFTDWRDASGNLIPIYDPATTRANPGYDPTKATGPSNLPFLRDQFQCNGRLNVICPERIQNSLAKAWFRFLPTPTNDGALNNFLAPIPVPDTILAGSGVLLLRIDHRIGDSDHFYASFYHQAAPAKFLSVLPQQIANESFSAPQDSNVHRFNWDHTFSPNLLHHFAFGFLNRNEGYGSINAEFAGEFPRIPGVAGYRYPPQINFSDGYRTFGNATGINTGNITTRPTFIGNNMFTWIKGNHTLKFGGEYRSIQGNIHATGNESGTFNFNRETTGLAGINSGSPIASFLLETVASGSVNYRNVDSWYPRQYAYVAHVGDTWKMTPKLTMNYGLRWDMFTPAEEKYDRLSFFDPYGPNPGAGGRPGRLAFAGDQYGAASFGRDYPEELWKKGFAPRFGLAYAITPKTVLRTGYGIFFTQAFYPGWGGGISLNGFNTDVSLNSSQSGLTPAFILSQGIPNFKPETVDPAARNGRGVLYRPFEANRRPYAQQWNLTLEHELGNGLVVSTAYVANKGTRLPSSLVPLNALDPKLLSLGGRLNDEFQTGQTALSGFSVPYPGWTEQLRAAGCAPTLAQALLPYPQYCDSLTGLNENAGNSTYHSFQAKGEKRFSKGVFLLASYTLSKLISDASDNTQRGALTWSGAQGVISPFERKRNKALASDDVPQVFSLTFVYELPFGQGRRFADHGGIVNGLVGGWQMSSIFRASSGIPFYFRSSQCNVPGQFRVGCIPGIKEGANPFLQDKDSFDPGKGPLFDVTAFEPVSSFNFYYGSGPRITNLRGFGYRNHDISFIKNTRIRERLNFQVRLEMFNIWNWHIFSSSGSFGGTAFTNDIASPDFGRWNGSVTNPRNIQLGARIEF